MLNSFILSSPGSIAFHIGSWPIRWYGIFIACGFLLAYFLAEHLINKNNLNVNYFNDLILLILIFGVVFARIYFVVLSWDYFKANLIEIPMIWHGGQSIHGGIFGAILAAIIYTRHKKISFFQYMDIIAVITPLGQAIGRWGNFFNNEAFGKPVNNIILKLYIPNEFRPEQYLKSEYFHPTFLYESILDIFIFIFLFAMFPKWKEKPGKIFWSYLLSYSIIRFFIEFLRTDSIYLLGDIASAHVVSVVLILISSIAIFKLK